MKLRKGDKVLYKDFEHKEKICPCCGHEDYDTIEKKLTGIIEDVRKDFVYNLDNGFTVADGYDEKTRTYRPYISSPKLTEMEEVYNINGSWFTKNAIIKII